MIFEITIGVIGFIVGIMFLIKANRKHQKIDTESIAVVKEIIYLGRDDGSKVYAIKYVIQSSEPFDLLVTPCKKIIPQGTERSIFYEKANPSKNYYFKTIGQFDSRFIMPAIIMSFGILSIVLTIIATMVG